MLLWPFYFQNWARSSYNYTALGFTRNALIHPIFAFFYLQVTPNLYGNLVANTAAGIAGGTGIMPGGTSSPAESC